MALSVPLISTFVMSALPFLLLAFVSLATLIRWGGIALLAYLAFATVRWAHLTFFTSNSLSAYRRRKDGKASWALVTGASDGIGKAFCRELLARQFNVIALSRNEEKLKAVVVELLATRKAGNESRCEYIVADAERATDMALYDHIVHETRRIVATNGGALAVLINNVGIEILEMGWLHEQKVADMDRMLNVNALFPTKLSAVLLPEMVARDADGKFLKNGGGVRTALINVSSYSSVVPAPFLTIYGATKAYNNSFSANLTLEYKEFGVDVLGITPAFVASAMTGTDKVTIERCSSKACAAGTLDKVANAWGESRVSPYWYHSLQELLSVYVYPRKLVERISYAVLKGNMKYHKRKREAAKNGGGSAKDK